MTDAPAVRTLNRIHERAIRERCSDIHVEPQPGGARVRFRVDGLLREAERVEEPLAAALVSRIKVLAGIETVRHPTAPPTQPEAPPPTPRPPASLMATYYQG